MEQIIRHPYYKPATLENDLVLLRLDEPVDRSLASDYLCLNSNVQDHSVAKLYTAGWGSTSPSHLSLTYPDQINYVDALVFSMRSCQYIIEDPAYRFLFNQV